MAFMVHQSCRHESAKWPCRTGTSGHRTVGVLPEFHFRAQDSAVDTVPVLRLNPFDSGTGFMPTGVISRHRTRHRVTHATDETGRIARQFAFENQCLVEQQVRHLFDVAGRSITFRA